MFLLLSILTLLAVELGESASWMHAGSPTSQNVAVCLVITRWSHRPTLLTFH